ncbi:MAG: sensor domain-containing diguanylate cyclase [Candidatus Omnitrophica bacterium]|nr:sensor domain-containing diguanylate cyclase [Candidatus Omnitrophota bacterium]
MSLTMDTQNIKDLQTLREKFDRATRDLTVLYEVSNAMRMTLDLNHILYIILTSVTSHTGLGFNRGILFLVNHKERCLEPQMAIGPESGEHAQRIWQYISAVKPHLEDLIKEENVALNMERSALFQSVKDLKVPLDPNNPSPLAKAYHDGTPVHITHAQIGQYVTDAFLQRFKTHELVIMPLKAKNKVNGLIVADNLFTQKPITDDELRIFMMLANQAGLAIENANLYELVRYKSHTDSITNLWNHGFFQDQLSKELESARQGNQPLTLLILDIDDFKKLNDTYGHHNGDTVLREIANILKDSSRGNDYACRYGGEEFAVILTQTPQDQGAAIAGRIRARIAECAFHLSPDSDGHKLHVSVSIGVASFPRDAGIKEELIAKADKAMYIAKFSGKNRVCCNQE